MSTLPPPDSARLAALDQHFRFGLSAADLENAPAVEASSMPRPPSSASTGVPPRRRRSESGSRPPRSATNSAPGTSPPCLPAHRKAR